MERYENRRDFRDRAFTAAELVIVCSVMLILSAIMYPVMQGGISKARQMGCAQKLRQLGAAFLIYAEQHDGFLPPYTNRETLIQMFEPGFEDSPFPTDSQQPRLLREAMDPYVSTTDLWFTDDDPVARQDVYYLCIRHSYSSFSYGQPSTGGRPNWPMMIHVSDLKSNTFLGDPVGSPAPRESEVWFLPGVYEATYHGRKKDIGDRKSVV